MKSGFKLFVKEISFQCNIRFDDHGQKTFIKAKLYFCHQFKTKNGIDNNQDQLPLLRKYFYKESFNMQGLYGVQ